MLNNTEALSYIDGVAVHWYYDDIVTSEVLNLARSDKKNLTLIMSEACKF